MDPKSHLWDPRVQTLPLREPKIAREIKNEVSQDASDSSKKSDINDILANSKLNCDAPEWYPNSLTNTKSETVGNSIQNRLKRHKKTNSDSGESASTEEVMPADSITNETKDADIRRLKQIISTLKRDPGQFDNLLVVFMETLLPYVEDALTLSVIAQLLVDEGINNPNFRYTGARLCYYVEQNSHAFRAELHVKSKKLLEDHSDTQNVLLFIAELYTHLPHLTVYGELLFESFNILLAKGGNNNIKHICQALKLTGFSLDQNYKNELDDLFNQLKAYKNPGSASENLLHSIFNLRCSNWGHSVEINNDTEYSDSFFFEVENPVFYQADGSILSNEESEFIAAHMCSNEEYVRDSDPDELCDPEPEMDEEIQEAFKEFLKLSRKP